MKEAASPSIERKKRIAGTISTMMEFKSPRHLLLRIGDIAPMVCWGSGGMEVKIIGDMNETSIITKLPLLCIRQSPFSSIIALQLIVH